MTSADATSKAQLNLENRSRPAWSESSTGGETNQAWSGSQGSGGSPRQSYSSPSKIENPEKTRSNWSRLVKSPDADVEQDHAVMKSQRSKSLHEAEELVGLQLREEQEIPGKARSVSFNGVSIMVDSILSVFKNVSKNNMIINTALADGIAANDVACVQKLIDEKTVSFNLALLASVRQDNVHILEALLPQVENVNGVLKPETEETLLHAAAAVGSLSSAKLLLENGARTDVWDLSGQTTPLHSATTAQNNAVKMVELLLNNGAPINAGLEREGGSVLHQSIKAGNVEVVETLLENKVETVPKTFYETALHIAAEENKVAIAELLLKHNPGCVDALKGRTDRSSALHLAADFGYQETCRVLIAAGADVSLTNGQQMTAIHLAARNRSEPVLRLLLTRSSNINTGLVNAQDANGRTPLFVCTASKGPGATDCMKTLLEFGAEVDVQNSDGYTALHMAAIDRKPARVNLLISRDADLSLENNAGFSSLFFINKKVPQCMRAYEDRLDLGLKLENTSTETSAKIKMDFNKLSPNINSLHRQDIAIFRELIKSGRADLIKHPLSQAFLYLKWEQIKQIYHFITIFCHLVYSAVYTSYCLTLFVNLCQPSKASEAVEGKITCELQDKDSEAILLEVARWLWVILLLFTLLYASYEALNFKINIKRYWENPESIIDILLIVSFPFISFHQSPWDETITMSGWQFQFAAVGCFLTWIQMMFFIGKMQRFGKYVQMFKTVTFSVLQFMFAWLFLLLAFIFSFVILFPHYVAFKNPGAIIKVLIMMFGEIEYENLFYPASETVNLTSSSGSDGLHGSISSTNDHTAFTGVPEIMMLLFIFLVSIILMNLLVGLAVSDISELSKTAKLRRLTQQVDLINYIEGWLFTRLFKMSPHYVKRFLRSKLQGLKDNKNYNMVYTVNPFDMNDKLVPTSLKNELYDNCIRREHRSREFSRDQALKDMQMKIDRIFSILVPQSGGQPELQHSASRLSVLSSQLLVEDDAGSDGEVERLSNIIEEEEVVDRWVRRRSNASVASVNGVVHSYDICDL